MTKLETELDKIISQYDVKYWRADTTILQNVDSISFDDEIVSNGSAIECFVNDTLNEELKDFAKTFFSNVENFNDLTFHRLSENQEIIYDEDYAPKFEDCTYISDSLQFSGKYYLDIIMNITNACSLQKLRIKKGKVRKLTNVIKNGDFDVLVWQTTKNDKITISVPYLTLELTDAEFEQVK